MYSSKVIFSWQLGFDLPFLQWQAFDSSPQRPESTSWNRQMHRYCTLGIVCMSSLQSGQLTTMMNQCEAITDSLRLLQEKITGNNWDSTTCGSFWGVESNPLCPELWILEVHWNWQSGMVSALNKIMKPFSGPFVLPFWGSQRVYVPRNLTQHQDYSICD